MLKNSSRFIPVPFILIAAVILLNACSFSAKTTERYYQKAQATTYDVVAVPGVPFTEAGWDSTM